MAATAQSNAGSPFEPQQPVDLYPAIMRHNDYFTWMIDALAVLDNAQHVIDSLSLYDAGSAVIAQAALSPAYETYYEKVALDKANTLSIQSKEQALLAQIQQSLPIVQQQCANGDAAACEEIPLLQATVKIAPKNILVYQGIVDSLTLMLPPPTGSF